MTTTRDLCEDCWQEVHPTEYKPFAMRMGECDRCGWRQLPVVRSHIEDEAPDHPGQVLVKARNQLIQGERDA